MKIIKVWYSSLPLSIPFLVHLSWIKMFSLIFFKSHHSPTLTHSVARFHTHITHNLSATSTAPNNAVMLENHPRCWTVDTMTCFINNKDTTSYQVPILACIQTGECPLHRWPVQGSLLYRHPESIMTFHDSCGLLVRVKRDYVLTCPILKCKTGMYVCNINKTQTSPYFIYRIFR